MRQINIKNGVFADMQDDFKVGVLGLLRLAKLFIHDRVDGPRLTMNNYGEKRRGGYVASERQIKVAFLLMGAVNGLQCDRCSLVALGAMSTSTERACAALLKMPRTTARRVLAMALNELNDNYGALLDEFEAATLDRAA